MKFTNRMKIDGEIAVRAMSEKAQIAYNSIDPLHVYGYDDADENTKLYSYDGCAGSGDYLKFAELQSVLEALYDAFEGEV